MFARSVPERMPDSSVQRSRKLERQMHTPRSAAVVRLLALIPISMFGATALAQQAASRVGAVELKPFAQGVPPAAYQIEMVPIPGSDDGAIKPFFISKTEVTWEAMDVYVYRLDEEKGDNPPGVDAVSRPSKPYIPPDRGFGHEGYAAISVSFKNAAGFCEWLSTRTGRKYRLATEAEWEHAARGGGTGDFGSGEGQAPIDEATITEYAWLASNSNDTPHPVGSRKPNGWGLFDMFGNAREWVIGANAKPTSKGGSYKDQPAEAKCGVNLPQTSEWNASDPQVPKSKWWLSDGPFIGFRIICEADPATGKPAAFTPAPAPAAAQSPTQAPAQSSSK